MTQLLSLWRGAIAKPIDYGEPARILQDVADRHGVSVNDIKSSRRDALDARQEAMWRLTQLTKADGSWRLSLTWIARLMDKHHTSISHGARVHAAKIGETYRRR